MRFVRILVLVFFVMNSLMAVDSDKIMAIVNDEIITLSDVQNQARKINVNKQNFSESELHKLALDGLIDQAVQLDLAQKMSIDVDQSKVKESIRKFAKQQGLSLEEFKQKIESSGESYEDFSLFIKDQLILAKLQKTVLASKVKISKTELQALKKELENAKQQVHLIDWVFEVNNSSSTSQWRQMKKSSNDLKKLLRTNHKIEEFKEGVKTDLGWREVSSLPDLFADKIRFSKAKSIIGPIKAPNGFHVLYVVDIKVSKKFNDDEVYNILFFQKMQKDLAVWIKDLRSKAVIEIVDNE
jgi:peptidyl-prolyl cis-trans isomerase SurA